MESPMLPEGISARIINPNFRRGNYRLAIIDFDGTLSLLREGWDKIMVPLMVEVLAKIPGNNESQEKLLANVQTWVFQLNGQPTIKQMQALADEVSRRGGQPESAPVYKQEYLRRLMIEVDGRKAAIRSGKNSVNDWVVPGAHLLLQTLKKLNIPMMLSSGTDLKPLREEAELLQLSPFFDQGIFGPEGDQSTFTKAQAVDSVLARLKLTGDTLLNIGDGFVETKLTKERGGLAVGVAFNAEHPGNYHPWRSEQLIQAGVDVFVPDLRQADRLIPWLMQTA